MRRSMIPVLKEDRNHIDCRMLDLIAADDLIEFQVFAMLHTDEDRLRDVTIDIPDNRIADEIDSDGLDDLEEEELDEMFQQRLKHRIRVVNRKRHIVRTYGLIPYSVGERHVDINRGFYPNVSLVHLPSIISAGCSH
ncbi:hypothetical protein MRS44_006228 [Fusarium solani]|uniref:uncharacterized protein n=1 Tax=Fusarium solani TaxID=169388 RepID=UPI0032C45D82|nr:hypothetical protein MRS44_006228 [Fusarium solani]